MNTTKSIVLTIVLLCFHSKTFSSSDSTADNFDHTITVICMDEDDADPSWFYQNSGSIIGSIIGAFLVGIVALISIHLTHKKNSQLQEIAFQKERESREDIYCGNLFAIYHEIDWHNNLSQRLRKELEIVKDEALSSLEFPYDEANELFRIEYLDKCRINVLEFSRFDTDLLALISTYLNLVMTINKNLNFQAASHLKDKFNSNDQYKEAIKLYFEELEKLLVKADQGMENIQKGIIEVVESFPGNQLTFGAPEEEHSDDAV